MFHSPAAVGRTLLILAHETSHGQCCESCAVKSRVCSHERSRVFLAAKSNALAPEVRSTRVILRQARGEDFGPEVSVFLVMLIQTRSSLAG